MRTIHPSSLGLLLCLLSSSTVAAQSANPSEAAAPTSAPLAPAESMPAAPPASEPPPSTGPKVEEAASVPEALQTDTAPPNPSVPPDPASGKVKPPEEAVEAPLDQVDESAILAQIQSVEEEVSPRGVSLSGFMDFNYGHTFNPSKLLESSDRNDSFYVGRANVYIHGNITEQLRSLIEIRFSYLPNGVPDGKGNYQRTATVDYADYNRPLNLGGIEIERAHGEYEFDQLFTMRVGQYLTPYGIWNVDHGTPSVIPVAVPYVIGQGLFPERQTGFQAFGRYDLSDELQVEYHATLSNGRGPFDSHRDLDKNKAVGGRLKLAYQSKWGDLSLGASGYYGKNTDALAKDLNTGKTTIVKQAKELSLAGDFRWTFKGIQLQSEVVHKQAAYTEKGRRLKVPDRGSYGAYGLAGYRIPVLELMPFVKYERQSDEFLNLSSWCAGLNYRPLPELVLKATVTWLHHIFEELTGNATQLDTQIAWAF
jgi:hypothetical protein